MYRSYRRKNYNYPVLATEMLKDGCTEQEDIYDKATCSNVDDMYSCPTNECECGYDEIENGLPVNPMLAQSYVPFQKLKKTFTPEVGLKMGTIFPELVSPYEPNQSIEEIHYIKERNEIKGGCNDA